MSAKYQRVKQADLALPAPLRWITRAFSSITLAVILLCIVSLYGVLASVPVFFLFLGAAYAGVLLGTVGMAAALSLVVLRQATALPRWLRGLVALAAFALAGAAAYACCLAAYDWALHHPFFMANRGAVIYRLPFFEMTELEFYSWWPLRLVLILFVINMVWATIRRIEFKFVNLGVLTVHTGIVILALGAILYGQFKVEGNMVLFRPDHNGRARSTFYDATTPAIYLAHGSRQVMIPMDDLPRYNDYAYGELDLTLHDRLGVDQVIGGNVRVSIPAFYAYSQLTPRWVDLSTADANPADALGPAVELTPGHREAPAADQRFTLVAGVPAERVIDAPLFALEFLDRPDPQRIEDLRTAVDAAHGLIVEVPDAGYREVFPIEPGREIVAGDTGYTLTVKEVGPYGLPFVTPGYRGAVDTRALVEVRGPDKLFNRIVMHRYPERSQDFIPDPDDPGVGPMGRRADPDPAVRLTYLDNSKVQYHLMKTSEAPSGMAMIFRIPGQPAVWAPLQDLKFPVPSNDAHGGATPWLHLTGWMDNAVQVREPVPTPRVKRDPKDEGTYLNAVLPVLIETDAEDGSTWRQLVYLRFMQYPHVPDVDIRPTTVSVPGLGDLTLTFSRQRHQLPFAIALERFEMQPYPGSDIPRDFVADLRIAELDENGQPAALPQTYTAQLNNPVIYRSGSGPLHLRKIKISQIGWDPGVPEDPDKDRVNAAGVYTNQQRFTILGVSNNVGINIIALGATLIILGIPWAFYVKPALVQRQKRRIQEQIAQAQQPTTAPHETREPQPV